MDPHLKFSGPNGEVSLAPRASRVGKICFVLESPNQFDTSKVEQLKIDYGDSPSTDLPYRALLLMKHLHTLTLYCFASPHIFVHALHPNMSSSGVVVCPKLEELSMTLVNGMTLDVKSVIEVAAARALRGARLKFVRIGRQEKFEQVDVLELEEYILHVERSSKLEQ
jgi:hypothetical protein